MSNDKILACGCAVNAHKMVDGKKVLCCVTHGCEEVAEQPDLTGRVARYSYCNKTRESVDYTKLAFFEYRKGREFDGYYCGCQGWS